MNENMTQEQRLGFLVEEFKADSGKYRDLQTPSDAEGKRRLLRALMNIRMPRTLPDEVLAVQDFGSEPAESAYMGNKINVMKAIVEYRGDRADMITHFTSNLSLTGTRIGDMYGDRVSSRLRQMCNVYILKGKDRRI